MRFGAGQHLIDRKQTVEAGRIDSLLLFNHLTPNHFDLSNRAAPSKKAEAQETNEESAKALPMGSEVNQQVLPPRLKLLPYQK